MTGRGLVLAAIVAGLLMTQSRGPWIGVGLALVFALLMRVLSWGKAAMVFAVLVAVFSVVAYNYGSKYTEKEFSQASDEEQRDAIYRRDLLKNYTPLVMQHKAFGWGISAHPDVNGQKSIDNDYLMLAVTQGFTGLGLFLAIVAGTVVRLLRMASRPLRPEDRGLVFAHLAMLTGLLTTITTVYMGEQALILFFLMAGWVQGMNRRFGVGAFRRWRFGIGARRGKTASSGCCIWESIDAADCNIGAGSGDSGVRRAAVPRSGAVHRGQSASGARAARGREAADPPGCGGAGARRGGR